MNELCPACGRRFEREPGYFTGAMYASYGLGFLVVAPVWIAMLAAGASVGAIILVAVAILAVSGPLMFRYSRVLWMHFDVYFNGPGDADPPPPTTASDRSSS